ncbi:MAG: type II secretion system protein GspD [Gammaproteobacteria bacterium RIFCSPLOWO2_02_FULL_42_14]|nr:MAG: type II secretion system protein GspD [Gammaproteobacteria bacterium RIFCSPHIGHO2_02_FULL_42_43]OGT28986.1 MAG: type II secretion system protein GspD [Gammaproteobacteria bacterium RIFCSPHIGHO2_01_FULL_42_8]OGT51730.1 MAG: type II secretion system protein GspD [Gammaproteobacteria bacterium RIFCSPHIGHO2_12_FULL_41_25]OGT61627.1 MAG: type II secretion system protein GspD [Gammaproteobacteria bacterium RIFCSPLOWO2_02_FULL_42_14]OGT86251.1 MAG: type II secretion system protein GspD [Gammap
MRFARIAKLTFCLATVAATACFAVTVSSAPIQAAVVPPPTTVAPPPISMLQTWNLKDADIRAVIQTVSLLTGQTFLVDPRVQGKITLISQKPMTSDELKQVFLSMLQLLHFSAIPAGDVTKIVPAADANIESRQIATGKNPGEGDEVVVRIIPVSHISAMELVPVLRPLMSLTASVTAYMPSNSLILAGSASNIERLAKLTRQMDVANATPVAVVHLQFANAKRVVGVIQKLQNAAGVQPGAQNAVLSADEEDNSILLSGNLANQLMMRNLIRKLDQPGAGGDDTQVVSLNYLSAKKLAPILAKIASGMSSAAQSATSDGKNSNASTSSTALGGSGDISVQAEESDNAIVMHAPRSMLSSLKRVIQELDHHPQEVLVEAIIVKIDENVLNKLGIVWGTPSDNLVNPSAAPSSFTTTDTSNTSSSLLMSSNNVFAMQLNHSNGIGFLPSNNLVALLHALKTNGSADVLSTPSVVVLNNQKALISDGQNLGVFNRSYQGVNATPGVTDSSISPYNVYERTDVALSLNVTPHISPNNMIQLMLKQEDDSVASGSSTGNPILNKSKINTSVLVHSGDILVLGGLIDNEDEKTVQKLPILGDIPILGHLFRYDTHTMRKKSLMVFIRPIIMSKSLAKAQTMNRYKYIRHREIQVATTPASQIKMPMLPEIQKTTVKLPGPVASMELPPPARE